MAGKKTSGKPKKLTKKEREKQEREEDERMREEDQRLFSVNAGKSRNSKGHIS